MTKPLVKPKKLTPASIVSQKKWSGLPVSKKNSLRKMLPDIDRDGVPNKYDCHPNNRRKQEEFNETDLKYLSTTKEVKKSKKLGEGRAGQVHLIKGNPNMVIKIPECIDYRYDDPSVCEDCYDRARTEDEINRCETLGINSKPFLCPSKAITVNRNGHKCVGIARPVLKPLNTKNGKKLTDGELEKYRQALISLSKDGITFNDFLQCGFTASGRLLQFDLEDIHKTTVSKAFVENNCKWGALLSYAGKFDHCPDHNDRNYTWSRWQQCKGRVLDKYGRVEP